MMASRSRRYASSGMGSVPMALGPNEIGAAVEAYGSPLPRRLLDAAVFELDGVVLTSNGR
ncbi:hypothetical protein PAEH1_01510 [Paenalcaligenes hominis]|uniref:Uncharacterized protein n=1 Tax=Paenalcaligenes hominis TaxID=643674 RepID=A0A1U9JXS8_9BURK|nr:hypothetical protein PAEH1_01510 [Paenalcaligenes hominis]